jgi:hypothetical protein
MKAKVRKGMLILTVPLLKQARKSKSGKTILIATSSGPKRTSLRFDKNPVMVIVNAYIRPEKPIKRAKTRRKAHAAKLAKI